MKLRATRSVTTSLRRKRTRTTTKQKLRFLTKTAVATSPPPLSPSQSPQPSAAAPTPSPLSTPLTQQPTPTPETTTATINASASPTPSAFPPVPPSPSVTSENGASPSASPTPTANDSNSTLSQTPIPTSPPVSETFYVRFQDTIDSVTEARKNEIIEAFQSIAPGTLKGRVKIGNITAGSIIVQIIVENVPQSEWISVRQKVVQPQALASIGAIGGAIASTSLNEPVRAEAGPSQVVCGDKTTLAGNVPISGQGTWTTKDPVIIANPFDGNTIVRGLPIGITTLTWTVQLLTITNSSSTTIERIVPPALSTTKGLNIVVPSNSTLLEAQSSSNVYSMTQFRWSLVSGSGIITNLPNTSTRISLVGYGKVTVKVSAVDSLCGDISNFVFVTFPLPSLNESSSCTSSTCNQHGQCTSDGTCLCYASSMMGYYEGLSCGQCQNGYVGERCSVRVCNTMSCRNGLCNADGSQCVCFRNNTHGFWGGMDCTVCLKDASLGFWDGATCTDCAVGFVGAQCVTPCDDKVQCSGRGTCSRNGCRCDQSDSLGYWMGLTCNTCIQPYFGPSCNTTCFASKTCSGHGDCVPAGCQCYHSSRLGFYTTDPTTTPARQCNVCAPGYGGLSCLVPLNSTNTSTSQSSCVQSNRCRHGRCDQYGNCVCFVDPQQNGVWDGTNCDVCSSNTVLGFWKGVNCTECVDGYRGANCTLECPFSKCSGRGSCLSADGACNCKNGLTTGYWDSTTGCATCAPDFYGSSCLRKCTNIGTCSGHGECDAKEGTCNCWSSPVLGFWSGLDCSFCKQGKSLESNCTACVENFYGESCEVMCQRTVTCNNRGNCNTVNGSCICDVGNVLQGFWGGPRCASCSAGYTGFWCNQSVRSAGSSATCVVDRNTDISSIKFTSTFQSIDITFTNETDRGQAFKEEARRNGVITGETNCGMYFDPEVVVTLLGVGSTCDWVTSFTLRVTLGVQFNLDIGTTLTLASGVIKAKSACLPMTTSKKYKVEPPDSTQVPVAKLTAAQSVVNHCSDITLIASASIPSSPRMTYTYQLLPTATTYSSTSLSNFLLLTPSSTTTLVIPSANIPPNEYAFQLILTDTFTGATSMSTVVTVTKLNASNAVPAITLLTNRNHDVVRTQRVVCSVEVTFNPCVSVPVVGFMVYKWTLYFAINDNVTTATTAVTLPPTIITTASTFVIPPNFLQTNSKYMYQVKVTDPSGANGIVNGIISVGMSPLQAQFSVLSATASNLTIQCDCRDPDNLSSASLETIEWFCTVCSMSEQNSIRASAGNRTLTIIGATSSNLNISVRYAKLGRVVSQSLHVTVLSSAVLYKPLFPVIIGQSVLQPSKRSTLTAAVPDSENSTTTNLYRFQWSCDEIDLLKNSVTLTGVTDNNLVLRPGTLPSGADLHFRVVVMSLLSSSINGSASIEVRTTSPPSCGTLTVTDSISYALTPNTLTASSWIGSAPLEYQFSLIRENGEVLTLREFSANPVFEMVTLQCGFDGSGGECVEVYWIVVRDSNGDTADTFYSVVTMPASPTDINYFLDEGVTSSLDVARRSGDVNIAFDALLQVAGIGVAVKAEVTTTALDVLSTISSVLHDNIAPKFVTSVRAITTGSDSSVIQTSAEQITNLMSQVLRSYGTESIQMPQSTSVEFLSVVGNVATAFDAKKNNNSTTTTPNTNHRSSDTSLANVTTAVQRNIDLLRNFTNVVTNGVVPSEDRSVQTDTMGLTCLSLNGDPSTNQKNNGVQHMNGASLQMSATKGSVSCMTTWGSNIFSAISSTSNQNITSKVVTITLASPQSPQQTIQPQNVTFTIPLTSGTSKHRPGSRPICTYFDFTTQRFSSRGCAVVYATLSAVTCTCTHLTDFAAEEVSATSLRPHITLSFGDFANIQLVGIIYVAVISGVFCVLIMLGFWRDQHIQKQIICSTIDITSRISDIRRRSSVRVATQSTFMLDAASVTSLPFAKPERPAPGSSFAIRALLRKVFEFHPWCSPFTSTPNSHFTIPQRVWLLACLTMSSLMFNGLFYSNDDRTEMEKNVNTLYALICVAVAAPLISTVVSFLFTITPRTPFDARYWTPSKSTEKEPEVTEFTTSQYVSSKMRGDVKPHEFEKPVSCNAYELEQIEMGAYTTERLLSTISIHAFRCITSLSTLPYGAEQDSEDDTDDVDIEEYKRNVAYLTPDRDETLSPPLEPYLMEEQDTRHRPRSGGHDAGQLHSPFGDDNNEYVDDANTIAYTMNVINLAQDGCAEESWGRPLEPYFAEHLPRRKSENCIGPLPQLAIHTHYLSRNPVVLALQACLGVRFDPEDPFFLRCERNEQIQTMWVYEGMQCAWRLAIEAVKVEEFKLAETLFEMALYIRDPDLLFVFHQLPVRIELHEAVSLIVARHNDAGPQPSSTMTIGRSWSMFYAWALNRTHKDLYNRKHVASESIDPRVVTMLLGLNMQHTLTVVGCVDYHLQMESGEEHDSVPFNFHQVMDTLANKSVVLAAHMCRRLWNDDSLWNISEDDMLALATEVSSAAPNQDDDDGWKKWRTWFDQMNNLPHEYKFESHSLHKSVYSPIPMVPHARKGFIPAVVLKKFSQAEVSHTNFNATIEFGRFAAMMMCRVHSGKSFSRFAQMYLLEEDYIRSYGPVKALSPSEDDGWNNATFRDPYNPNGFVQSNNHFKIDSDTFTHNEYLSSLLAFSVTGCVGARFMIGNSTVTLRKDYGHICFFQPQRRQGTGSAGCPYRSWGAAVDQCRIGDIIHMLPGEYTACEMSDVYCSPQLPVVFACPFRGVVLKPSTDTATTTTAVRLRNVSNVRFQGIEAEEWTFGIQCENAVNIVFSQCSFHVDNIGLLDGATWEGSSNRIHLSGKSVGWTSTFMLPWPFLALSYVIVVGMYVMMLMMTLFVTAAMTERDGTNWIARCGVTILLKVFLISPIMAVAKTTMSVFNGIRNIEMDGGDGGFDFDIGGD